MKPDKTLIEVQTKGLPLPGTSEPETKIEYQARSNSNRIIASFSDLELLVEWNSRRMAAHGNNAPVARAFKVTTISEEI